MPKDLGNLPHYEITLEDVTGNYWVLNKPGSKEYIMSKGKGTEWAPLTFESEADALRFKELYGIPGEFVPKFIPTQH